MTEVRNASEAFEKIAVKLSGVRAAARALPLTDFDLGEPPAHLRKCSPGWNNDDLTKGVGDRVVTLEQLIAAARKIPVSTLRGYGGWMEVTRGLVYRAVKHPVEAAVIHAVWHEISSQPGAFEPKGAFVRGYDPSANEPIWSQTAVGCQRRIAAGLPVTTEATVIHIAAARSGPNDASPPQSSPEAAGPKVPQTTSTLLSVPTSKALPPIAARDFANTSALNYQLRPLIGDIIFLRELTMIAAEGAAGKSTFIAAVMVSVVLGIDILGFVVPHARKAVYFSGEESAAQAAQRVHAVLINHGCSPASLAGRLHIYGVEDAHLLALVVIDPVTRQARVNQAALDNIRSILQATGAQLLVIDPLVAFFHGDVNASGIVAAVMIALKHIAFDFDCAIIIAHHVAKGRRADTHGAEAASGSAALSNLCRSVYGLTSVDGDTARGLGIPPGDEQHHFKLMSTKSNLVVKGADRVFRRKGVHMANGTAEFPSGDWVPVALPFSGVPGGYVYPQPALRAVLVALAQGNKFGQPYSPSTGRSSRPYVDDIAGVVAQFFPKGTPHSNKATAKDIIKKLLGDGWVEDVNVRIPKTTGGGGSSNPKGLIVRWSNTPWHADPAPGTYVK